MKRDFPEGWRVLPLRDIASIHTGLALGKNGITDPVTLPYLRVANVQDGHLDLNHIRNVSVSRRDITRYLLRHGDVLLTEGGDFDKLGRGYLWRGEIDPCLHQNHIFAVRPNTHEVSSQYLAAFISSRYAKKYFLSCSKRSTNLASINSTEIKNLKVALPPLEEQNKIVKILSTWELADGALERLITLAKVRRRGLTAELLSGKGQLEARGWRQVCLGQLFSEREECNREDLPLLAITSDRGVIARAELGRKDSSSEDKSRYKRIAPGDIGFNTMRMWQGVSALSTMEGIVSPAYTVCIPNEQIDGLFASYLFKYPPVVHLFHRYSQGLVNDTLKLSFADFGAIRVNVPPVAEQRRITGILSAIDVELKLLESYKSTVQNQKRGLTEELITARLRVREVARCD